MNNLNFHLVYVIYAFTYFNKKVIEPVDKVWASRDNHVLTFKTCNLFLLLIK